MKKLLMVTIELPFPATSGGRIKSWNMLKALTQHYKVSLAAPIKYGYDEFDQFKSAVELKKFYCETVERERSAKNLIKSYMAGIPLNVYRSRSHALLDQIAADADQFDIIFLDHYESFQYLPANFKGKVILHTHNATYLMWERYATSGEGLAMRTAAALEARRVKGYEKKACNRADLVFAAPNDIDNLSQLGCDRSKFRETFHLGDDSQLALDELNFADTQEQLFYVGTLNWEANVDGLIWFLQQIWPAIKAERPGISFKIAGGKPDPRLIAITSDLNDVELLGFVDDLEPHFKASRLFIAPLRFGSGIKVKVLNTMCRGLPIVTTTIGAEGLEVLHMKHMAIADSVDDTLASIEELLDNGEQWTTIRDRSREIIREKYTWSRVLGNMISEIDLTLNTIQPDVKAPDEAH